ncbi:MAG: ATP-binding protein [Flavobacteriaceae bacterium]
MDLKRIVVTGGPSTGKTSVIQKLEEMGFSCMEEIIRAMTVKEKKEVVFKTNPIVSVTDPLKFNLKILGGRIEQHQHAQEKNADIIFFDRGIPDVLAYMDCFGQNYGQEFESACERYRYDLVFLMPPWREIHIEDEQRFETYEESLRIHNCLRNAYETFGYTLIEVPKLSIEKRIDFILQNLGE